ncbi:MAG: hypothetical protein ACFFCS_08495 [Candidatus Hodarchaeota archaeon]
MMSTYSILSIIHNIGVSLGVGSATLGLIINIKASKNPDFKLVSMKIRPLISQIIWVALILLGISGTFLMNPAVTMDIDYMFSGIKHVIVIVIVMNGIILTLLGKKIGKIAPKPENPPSKEFLKASKTAQLLGFITVACWYVVIILSSFI